MRSLESRIAALEALRPAPNVAFVARYKPDGSLIPLEPGMMYGRHVTLVPELCATVAQWLERYGPRSDDHEDLVRQRFDRATQRALEAFEKLQSAGPSRRPA